MTAGNGTRSSLPIPHAIETAAHHAGDAQGRCFEVGSDQWEDAPHFSRREEAEAERDRDAAAHVDPDRWPDGLGDDFNPAWVPVYQLDEPCVSVTCGCGDTVVGQAPWKSAEHFADRGEAMVAALADGYAVETIIDTKHGRARDQLVFSRDDPRIGRAQGLHQHCASIAYVTGVVLTDSASGDKAAESGRSVGGAAKQRTRLTAVPAARNPRGHDRVQANEFTIWRDRASKLTTRAAGLEPLAVERDAGPWTIGRG